MLRDIYRGNAGCRRRPIKSSESHTQQHTLRVFRCFFFLLSFSFARRINEETNAVDNQRVKQLPSRNERKNKTETITKHFSSSSSSSRFKQVSNTHSTRHTHHHEPRPGRWGTRDRAAGAVLYVFSVSYSFTYSSFRQKQRAGNRPCPTGNASKVHYPVGLRPQRLILRLLDS